MNNTVWVANFEVRDAQSKGPFRARRLTVIACSTDDAYAAGQRALQADPLLEIGYPISVEPYPVGLTPLPRTCP